MTIETLSMYISKAVKSGGQYKLQLTGSDTGLDLENESMSLGLFYDFVSRLRTKVPNQFIPALQEKSGWDGTEMPYVSISHYNSGKDGKNIVGTATKVYVDGDRLKAQVLLPDTPLARASFSAIKSDLDGTSKYKNPVRVSIRFLDLSHSHGDFVFERKSITDKCPLCGVAKEKTYLRGQLIHFALTRRPANPRTEIGVMKMEEEINTQKDDAASIVGDELANELNINRSIVSDIVVERSNDVHPADEENSAPQKSELEQRLEELAISVETNKNLQRDAALMAIQPALDAVAETIKSMFPEPTPVKVDGMDELKSLLTEIEQQISTVSNRVNALTDEMTILKSALKSDTNVLKAEVAERPAPRTMQPSPDLLSEVRKMQSQSQVKPNSIAALAWASTAGTLQRG